MANKTENIVHLAAQTAQQISANSGNYMAFLTTAAHNFKYSFRDQLLIFAQKPDATACAQIDFWNKYGRWVNRGTTGIALLVDTDRGYKLRKIETSPCRGKWRGTSDISIRFDNGASLAIGNYRTPKAKTVKVQSECVNAVLVRYNPEIVQATKEAAIPSSLFELRSICHCDHRKPQNSSCPVWNQSWQSHLLSE